MSNQNTTGQSHLASISNDPMDEQMNTGLDEVQSGRRDWRQHREWREPDHDHSNRNNSISMRPLLLAGALGMFAAWIVSGTSEKNRSRGMNSRRGGRDWGTRSGMGSRRERIEQAGESWSPAGGSGFRGSREDGSHRRQAGPEGASSMADMSFDAMNP